jgi:hypothetical protein
MIRFVVKVVHPSYQLVDIPTQLGVAFLLLQNEHVLAFFQALLQTLFQAHHRLRDLGQLLEDGI